MYWHPETPLRQRYLSSVGQTSPQPMLLEIQSASGSWIHSTSGKAYLDLISGISVSNLGHGRTEIVQAIQNQAAKYLHTMVYGEHIQAPQVALAEALTNALGHPFKAVYFVNSGSEAIEAALKLARRHTGRFEVVSFINAYHGSTMGALSAMGSHAFSDGFLPIVPGHTRLPFNEIDALKAISSKYAAVLVEPVQGEAGYIWPEAGFLEAIAQKCQEHGCLLIFDEIQTAYARCGKLFAFHEFNVQPDIVVLAKSLGGGMPLGALAASQNLLNSFTHLPVLGHISTFGGHPVSCAAGLAALEIVQNEKLAERALWVESRFRHFLHPEFAQKLKGKACMMSLELENFQQLQIAVQLAFDKGVLIDWFLFNDRSLRLAPPLNILDHEIEFACEALNQALSNL